VNDMTKKPFWHAGAEKIALERIEILFAQAEKEFASGRPDLANRYVELARKIGMKTNTTIPPPLKKRFCRHCHAFLVQGKNAETRLVKRILVVKCGACGHVHRYPYSKK